MISTNDFRNGTMFEMDGQLLSIVSVEHIKLARAGAVIKAKLRNVLTGSIFEQSFRSGDKYRTVRIDSTEATYSYSDGTHHYFMDTKTYDQVPVDDDILVHVDRAHVPHIAEQIVVGDDASTAHQLGCRGDQPHTVADDALQDVLPRIRLPEILHRVDELLTHGYLRSAIGR